MLCRTWSTIHPTWHRCGNGLRSAKPGSHSAERRRSSPWRRESDLAPTRSTMAARFFTFRVLVESTLPPQIAVLRGQSPSQAAKAEALRSQRTSGPTSVRTTSEVMAFTPRDLGEDRRQRCGTVRCEDRMRMISHPLIGACVVPCVWGRTLCGVRRSLHEPCYLVHPVRR